MGWNFFSQFWPFHFNERLCPAQPAVGHESQRLTVEFGVVASYVNGQPETLGKTHDHHP